MNQSRLAKNAPVLRDLRKAPVGAVLHLHVASFRMTHRRTHSKTTPQQKSAEKCEKNRVTRAHYSGRCGCYTWAAASAPEQYARRCRLLTPTQSARAALLVVCVCGAVRAAFPTLILNSLVTQTAVIQKESPLRTSSSVRPLFLLATDIFFLAA